MSELFEGNLRRIFGHDCFFRDYLWGESNEGRGKLGEDKLDGLVLLNYSWILGYCESMFEYVREAVHLKLEGQFVFSFHGKEFSLLAGGFYLFGEDGFFCLYFLFSGLFVFDEAVVAKWF